MHSNTFHFDGHDLSDFGCIICNFENNDGITVEGGNIEYITTKTPNSNKNSQVGNEYADPYRFTFSIMKMDLMMMVVTVYPWCLVVKSVV